MFKYQFGFRKQHSTELAIFEITDGIYKAFDNCNSTLGLFLDLSKAFDTVDHTILLRKLSHYGIRGTLLKWFSSYLSSRKLAVEVNGNLSKFELILCGIPQGSILGPLLFLLYVNDLPNCSNKFIFRLFADDGFSLKTKI